ncbi:glutathione S-transferase 1-like [Helicoverpa zea]|uniref:glutathione S-transferase 1-like n=1 Tax=Helicoverpa zea TaxID=7113 RepID=UPI001F595E6A|nr:glutathione S-transferase 1-like [Helicoverpa zea]
MVLTIYKMDRSPPVRAVFMTIEVLKIPNVQYVDVNLLESEHLKGDYLKMNPQHTVPVMKDDDFSIWDSHAIAAYLVTKYGKNSSLYPTDLKKRAVIDQRLHFDSGVLFPSLSRLIEPVFFKGEKAFRPDDVERVKTAYGFVDAFLSKSQWLAGDNMTLADICCVATISTLNEAFPVDEKAYPKLSAWFNRLKQQEFYKKRNEPGLAQIRAINQKMLSG